MIGRFAPSPSGELHLGNLRTAAIAWLSARAAGGRFLMRIEDLDPLRSKPEHERGQLADLAAIGLDWDGEVVRQSERFALYEEAIDALQAKGLVYECYCTRREIREEIKAASSAPHLPADSYPGTCRDLGPEQRDERRATGRTAALRLRTNGEQIEFVDRVVGLSSGGVDDFVLRRNDGAPAYNLAVVVDDEEQSITEVIRGDDLLDSTPRHILLQRLLGYETPTYAHVPLVVEDDGKRLAKRDSSIRLSGLRAAGVPPTQVVDWIGRSLSIDAPGEDVTMARLIVQFDLDRIPREPVHVPRFA
jgi:glutamyl-tRNA synthetase